MCCAFFSWFNHFLKSQNEMCFQWRKRGNVPELKWKSFWTHYFVQSCRNFQLQSLVLIPHFECVNAASSKYQGFPVCCFSWPKQSPRLRWKWLNYKQHFGLSRFYIKKKTKTNNIKVVVLLQNKPKTISTWKIAFSDAAEYLMWFHPVQDLSLCVVYVFVFLCFARIMSWNCLFYE